MSFEFGTHDGAGNMPANASRMLALPQLHHPLPQAFVFSGEQLLCQLITPPIDVVVCTGEMMFYPQTSGTTEIFRKREDFVTRGAALLANILGVIDLVLGERTGCANGE